MYNDNKIIDLLGGSMDGNILVNVGEQRIDRLREEAVYGIRWKDKDTKRYTLSL